MHLFPYILIFLFFSGLPYKMTAQKMLLLEKSSSVKAKKFHLGDELTFRLDGEKEWRTSTIVNLIPKDSIIVLDKQFTKLDNIVALKSFKNRKWSSITAKSLYTFGASWMLFTAGDELASSKESADWNLAIWVTSTSFATGYLIRTIFKSKTIRLGKKNRLRMLDLTLQP